MNYKLVPYTEEYYEFVYNVKKNAYMKYVEECWGNWNEEKQRKYFADFINKVKNDAYIIKYDNQDIGFYTGELIKDNTYEVGNICIIPEYQGKGIGTKLLKDIINKYNDYNIEIQYFKQNLVGNLYRRLEFIPNGETEYHYQMIRLRRK